MDNANCNRLKKIKSQDERESQNKNKNKEREKINNREGVKKKKVYALTNYCTT